MPQIKKKRTFLGLLAAKFLFFFTRKPKPTQEDIKKIDFDTSTQKMGVRFTEKIRNAFRRRWIKKR